MDSNATTRSIAVSAVPGGATSQGWVLSVCWPPDLAYAHGLTSKGVVVGRSPEGAGSLSLLHSTISRQHLKVSLDGASGRHRVSDLGSRNGSWVNGSRVGEGEVLLPDNGVIRLGDVLAIYQQSPGISESSELNLPGGSPGMVRLRERVRASAADPSPALILGETGAGKEFVAKELHRLSGRSGKMVSLNCAVLNAQLIESSLFGHVRGAFTGANTAQQGLFEAAEGGTLFLDEIGELPVELQPKLLRAIQEQEIRPVGSTAPRKVNVRIVAATNRDLVQMVGEEKFRRDLYARLALWVLELPAVRERRSDIPGWIARLTEAWCAERSPARVCLDFDSTAMERLLRYSWPENLRGINRLVHHLATSPAASRVIQTTDLPPWIAEEDGGIEGGVKAVSAEAPSQPKPTPPNTREELEAVFVGFERSVRATAKHYGRDRKQIYRWLDTFGIDRE